MIRIAKAINLTSRSSASGSEACAVGEAGHQTLPADNLLGLLVSSVGGPPQEVEIDVGVVPLMGV
jgi:hypothetical protein